MMQSIWQARGCRQQVNAAAPRGMRWRGGTGQHVPRSKLITSMHTIYPHGPLAVARVERAACSFKGSGLSAWSGWMAPGSAGSSEQWRHWQSAELTG